MSRVRLIGDRAMNRLLAPLPQVQDAVEQEATKIKARAEANLVIHRRTGEHRIEMTKNLDEKYGFLDFEVSLVGEAAGSVEFGHKHNKTGKPVDGLYIITRAAGLA